MPESPRNELKDLLFMKNDHRTTAVRHFGTLRTRALREPKSLKFDLNLGAFHWWVV